MPPFRTLFDTEQRVNVLNSLQGHGLQTYLDLHKILGHPSDEILWRTISGSNVDIKGNKKVTTHCPVCNKLRLYKKSRPAHHLRKNWATPNNDVVFRDIHGPLTPGIHGERYWEVFVSASSRKCWIFPIKHKSEVYDNFETIAKIYAAKNRHLAIIVNDNAKEYDSVRMKNLLKRYHADILPTPEYVKNGNLAEVWNLLIEKRCIANLLEGRAHKKAWPYSVIFSCIQLNITVNLNAPIDILHYLTPNQIWELPNCEISKIYSDMLNGTLNLNKAIQLVDKNSFTNIKPFWTLATVKDMNKSLGSIPADGLGKEGTWVYIGPADNNKASFKLLNLATLKTIESAFVNFETNQSQHDMLTNFDIIGGADNLARPSTAKQIRDCFDISGESLTSGEHLTIEEEQQASSSLSDSTEATQMDTGDQELYERFSSQNKKGIPDEAQEELMSSEHHAQSTESASMEDDLEEEQEQQDHSGDLELAKEMGIQSRVLKILPDNEKRQKQKIGERVGVKKIPAGTSESEANSVEDTENSSEYLRRYRLAKLPISFIQINPKRQNSKSFERYAKYKKATTIEQALEHGASWPDIEWDYNRGFLRCIHGAEARRLNPLVQRCMDEYREDKLSPQIGNVVTMFSIDPTHPAFAKQGKITGVAPQSAVMNNHVHTLNKAQIENDISAEEEMGDSQINPRQQTLFFSNNPDTGKTGIFYCNHNAEYIPYVPTINQLSNDFQTDSSPPKITDSSLHPSDRLYIFETLTDSDDQSRTEQYVAPLKAFVKHSSSSEFISREDAIKDGARYIESMLEDVENRHEWLKEREKKLPKLRDYINAISEGTRALSKTFGNSPFYINSAERNEIIPTKFENAMILSPENWGPSMESEIEQLINLGTWVLIPISSLKKGSNITGTTWAFRIKSDGRYRSRLCAQGFSQRFGIDYWDVYSSVATIESIRVAISLAAANKRRLSTFDVKNAFQNTDLPKDEEVHCKQAPGFEVDPNDPDESNQLLMKWFESLGLKIPKTINSKDKLVLKLRKALQGLKSSGRYFQQTLFAWLISENFRQLKSDDCCWVYNDGTIDCNVYVYVDDILVSSADILSEQHFEKIFLKRWKGSQGSGGLATALLGMSIHHLENNRILLNQSLMIADIALTFGANNGYNFTTPMAERFDPSYDESKPDLDTEQYNYRSLCGALLFVITHTRPDCSCACSMLCSAMAKPQQKHWDAAIRLARYLYLTKDLGLCYSIVEDNMMNKIYAMVDASWAAEKGARSRCGYIIKLNGATVCYRSKLINTICLSSAESETTAAVSCLKDVVWLRMHLWELGYKQNGSTPVYEDNQATISSASGNSQRKESRYYQMRTEFIRQLVKSGTMHFVYVATEDQAADALSKNLAPMPFIRHQPTILGAQPLKAEG